MNTTKNTKQIILTYLSNKLRDFLKIIPIEDFNTIIEIRIRIHKPIIIRTFSKEMSIYCENSIPKITSDIEKGYKIDGNDIEQIIERISAYSLYAYEEEIKNGFITIPCGHRVGISGKTVIEDGKVKTIKNINGFNIRICHEIKGCGEKIYKFIDNDFQNHTLILSPPSSGKTTLLRDLIRLISNSGKNVSVVDERSEISGCYKGTPQNDLGLRTDVLDGCPKDKAMLILLRSFAPDVIAVDEIGKKKDVQAIKEIIYAGVTIICTVHASSIEDIKNKPYLKKLVNQKVFKNYIILDKDNIGQIKGVYDKNFNEIIEGD